MIENESMMQADRPVRAPGGGPTYDGSLWGDDVCRCGGHVDPHRHTAAAPDGQSIYDEPDLYAE